MILFYTYFRQLPTTLMHFMASPRISLGGYVRSRRPLAHGFGSGMTKLRINGDRGDCELVPSDVG